MPSRDDKKSEKGMDTENITSKAADKIEVESEGLMGTHRFVIYYLHPDLIFHMLLHPGNPNMLSAPCYTNSAETPELITAQCLWANPARFWRVFQCCDVQVC